LTTEDAGAIAATLDDAGLFGAPNPSTYARPARAWVELLPILPDGDVACDCV
jgi:hypothetical protein